MPRIPQYLQTQTITPQSPSVKINPEALAGTGKTIAGGGDVLAQVEKKFENLRNLHEYTAASTEANERLTDLEARAGQDPDIWNLDNKYSQEAQVIRDETLGKITNEETRLKFQSSVDDAVTSKVFNIKRIAREKQIDQTKATMLGSIESLKGQYYNSANPLERLQLKNQLSEMIDNHVEMGVIDRAAGFQLKEKELQDMTAGQVENDIQINPELALKNINDGLYKDLPHGEKKRLLEYAESQVTKKKTIDEKALKDFQRANESKMLVQMWDQGLNLTTIKDAIIAGDVSNDFGEKMYKAITSDKTVAPELKASTFNRLQDAYSDLMVLKENNKESSDASIGKFAKFRADVLEAWGNGEVSDTDGKKFIENVANVWDDKLNETVNQLNPSNGFNAIKFWVDGYSEQDKEEVKARLNRELMKRVQAGENQDTVVQDLILKEQKRETPSLSMLPETPNAVIKNNGEMKKLAGSNVKIKADKRVSAKKFVVKLDPVTNVKAKVFEDGTFEVIENGE